MPEKKGNHQFGRMQHPTRPTPRYLSYLSDLSAVPVLPDVFGRAVDGVEILGTAKYVAEQKLTRKPLVLPEDWKEYDNLERMQFVKDQLSDYFFDPGTRLVIAAFHDAREKRYNGKIARGIVGALTTGVAAYFLNPGVGVLTAGFAIGAAKDAEWKVREHDEISKIQSRAGDDNKRVWIQAALEQAALPSTPDDVAAVFRDIDPIIFKKHYALKAMLPEEKEKMVAVALEKEVIRYYLDHQKEVGVMFRRTVRHLFGSKTSLQERLQELEQLQYIYDYEQKTYVPTKDLTDSPKNSKSSVVRT